MIKNVIDLLSTNDFYGVSENLDIAKGKYALPNGWKDAFSKVKRHSKSKREPLTWKAVFNKMIK
jgi:hypothetical protein